MHQDKKYFEKIGARGQLIVISGPSGVGKRTLVKEYLSQHPEVMDKVEKLLLDSLKPKEDKPEEKKDDITQKEIDEIMDIFVDEDGVIFEK